LNEVARVVAKEERNVPFMGACHDAIVGSADGKRGRKFSNCGGVKCRERSNEVMTRGRVEGEPGVGKRGRGGCKSHGW